MTIFPESLGSICSACWDYSNVECADLALRGTLPGVYTLTP